MICLCSFGKLGETLVLLLMPTTCWKQFVTCKELTDQFRNAASGLSTIVLAALGIATTTLEHDLPWARTCQEFAQNHDMTTNIIHAPLISYGDFDWYQVPPDLLSPVLVLCDGPPGTTRGGRYGFLPVLAEKLESSCTILMDDGERVEEQRIAQRWAAEYEFAPRWITGVSGTTILLHR